MKKVWLLLFILLIPLAIADREILMTDNIQVKTTLASQLDFIPTSGSFLVDTVDIQLFLFPTADERSRLLSFSATPDAKEQDDHLQFSWRKPGTEVSFKVEAVTETNGRFVQVKEKIGFPLSTIPDEIKPFLEPGEIIDSKNTKVIEKANSLASGENDAYEVTYKIGKWIQDNVDYSLDSLTVDASQKASWVIDTRRGVCDEITSLFIAMLRAVGIPAKFISGMAYTDFNKINDFGPHAWAEVYYPNIGWVPFDITYGEYGFVDAPHIKLKENIDADAVSTKFKWKGRNIDAETGELDIQNEILSTGNMLPTLLEVRASAFKKAIGFGSFNLIEAKVKNPNNFYVITDLSLTQNENIEYLDNFRKVIFLKPNEEKRFFWTLKVSGGLSSGFIYTIPIRAYTTRNASSTIAFEVTSNNPNYGLTEMSSYKKKHESKDDQVSITGLSLECASNQESIGLGEELSVSCTIKNLGNAPQENIEVCLDDCQGVSIGIGQEQSVVLSKKLDEIGEKTITVTAGNVQDDVHVVVFDKPSVTITNPQFPKEVEFGQEFQLKFDLRKVSFADLHDVRIIIKHASENVYSVENLQETITMDLGMKGSDIVDDKVTVTVEFKDATGNSFTHEEVFPIKLINLTFMQKVGLFFKRLF
tara:strand:+ start:1320 stop:3254 length:1935 start_codon:yes stop_codon:yes gene_type:complete